MNEVLALAVIEAFKEVSEGYLALADDTVVELSVVTHGFFGECGDMRATKNSD